MRRRAPKHRAQPAHRFRPAPRAAAATVLALAVVGAPQLLAAPPAQAVLPAAVTAAFPQRSAQPTSDVQQLMDARATAAGLGAPTSGWGLIRDGGFYRLYSLGAVLWTVATGAWESTGPARTRWSQLGYENGPLGYPASGIVTGIRNGGSYQMYQGGAIVSSPTTGTWESTGPARTRWSQLGYENGPLGYPASGIVTGIRNGGSYQMYQGGAMVSSPTTGTWESTGPIRQAWADSGFENGPLGYPTSGQYTLPNGIAQDYQGGRVEWRGTAGASAILTTAQTGSVSGGTDTVAQVQALVRQTAVQAGVDPALALAVAEQESGFRQNVISGAGAVGVMQIMPANKTWLAQLTGNATLDLYRIADNIAAGVALLRWLLAHASSTDNAIAGYYQGLPSVESQGMHGDTKAYVDQVKSRIPKFS